MASLILGIMGRKRSGKDTFAGRLVDEHGFTRLSFADALKAHLLDVDPWVRVEVDEFGILFGSGGGAVIGGSPDYHRLSAIIADLGWETAKSIREVRRLLQADGVAVRTHVKSTAWVDVVANQAAYIPGPVVVTDVRFPNEADWVQAARGQLVRVVRPGLDESDTHVSETALDGRHAHFLVPNVGTVADLHAEADYIASLGDYRAR